MKVEFLFGKSEIEVREWDPVRDWMTDDARGVNDLPCERRNRK